MNRISSRPRVQGKSSPLSLHQSGQPLTDGAGLLALRALWDRLDLGRWLRRAGKPVSRALDELIRRLVRRRWKRRGVPGSVTLVLDSTVVVRYGSEQAGTETGYTPKKPGRPSHHPLLAFTRETGDLIGLCWRPDSAWTAEGVTDWLPELVQWLRETGVGEITVRLDKRFCAERVVRTLQELEVSYLLKVPNHGHVRDQLGSWRESRRAEGIFEQAASCRGGWPASPDHLRDLDGEPDIWEAAPRASAVGPAPRTSITGLPLHSSSADNSPQ